MNFVTMIINKTFQSKNCILILWCWTQSRFSS